MDRPAADTAQLRDLEEGLGSTLFRGRPGIGHGILLYLRSQRILRKSVSPYFQHLP